MNWQLQDPTETIGHVDHSAGESTSTAPRPGLSPSEGPVLVATDGVGRVDTLCEAARGVAMQLHALIEVVGVCEPTPLSPGLGGDVLAPAELDLERQRVMQRDVQRALSLATRGDPAWPVNVRLGAPADVLACEAEQRRASLLVMGIGRHDLLDRLLGTETTLATIRRVRAPVLAVGPSVSAPPRVAVVGLDFSTASLRAARLALRLVGEQGRVALVHVRPRFDHPSADWRAWDQEYGRTLARLFTNVVGELAAPRGVTIDTVTLRGDPATALLAYAQQAGADLLGIGTQRQSVLERLLVGSVATRVIRNARIATLVVPSPEVVSAAPLDCEPARPGETPT